MTESILNSSQLMVLLLVIIIIVVVLIIYVVIKSKRRRRALVEDPGLSNGEVGQVSNLLNDYHNQLSFHLTLNLLDKVIVSELFNLYFMKECCIQSGLPLTLSPYSKFYIEVEIISIEEDTNVIFGLASKDETCCIKPGEIENSIGYSSNNGNIQVYGKKKYPSVKYGKSLKQGDILGIGYQNYTRQIYFTKNGCLFRPLKFPASQAPLGEVFPTIYSSGKCHLYFNNGAKPFVYFINNVEQEIYYPLLPPPPYSVPLPPSY
ncbi:hypothetical protein K502DRAFT_324971 [Neoconidiobolus thromboides FSU 785]|nr:hypothetical protein K502DRAFT_324971 [Neoconidiobolus thromboides FSU 785]